MKELVDNLKTRIFTKRDLLLMLDDINQLKEEIFLQTTIPLKERIKRKDFYFNEVKSEVAGSNFFEMPLDAQNEFLDRLKKGLESLEAIKLIVAVPIREHFVKKIKEWLVNNGFNVDILDIVKDPEIVGGAIIEYRGRYCNFSLAKEIEAYFNRKIYE